MKEGRIVLPVSLMTEAAMADAQRRLNAAFGGFTMTFGVGSWTPPLGQEANLEPIHVIDVAYEPEWDNDAKLYDIASRFQQEAKQESVYIRYANGNTQFVTAQSCMDNGGPEPFDWDRLRSDLGEPQDDPGDIVMTEEAAAGENISSHYTEDERLGPSVNSNA